MHSGRMQTRVASARSEGVARLSGMRLVLNKRGRDGTAKANLVREPTGCVWGVVWSFPQAEWAELDRAEQGYERIAVRLEVDERPVPAQTYLSNLLTDDPTPLAAYKLCITAGAREHALPPTYITLLESL
jgi:hypothetical protein